MARWPDGPTARWVTGLTAYDASYLWLAGWLEADLITLDRRLAAAVEPASMAHDPMAGWPMPQP